MSYTRVFVLGTTSLCRVQCELHCVRTIIISFPRSRWIEGFKDGRPNKATQSIQFRSSHWMETHNHCLFVHGCHPSSTTGPYIMDSHAGCGLLHMDIAANGAIKDYRALLCLIGLMCPAFLPTHDACLTISLEKQNNQEEQTDAYSQLCI